MTGSEVPPAFRPKQPSFVGLDDEHVLKMAQAAFALAQTLPAGSLARGAEWAKFDQAMGELASRATTRILARIREHEEDGPQPG